VNWLAFARAAALIGAAILASYGIYWVDDGEHVRAGLFFTVATVLFAVWYGLAVTS